MQGRSPNVQGPKVQRSKYKNKNKNKSLTLKKVFLVHLKLSAKQDGALVVEVGGLDIWLQCHSRSLFLTLWLWNFNFELS